MTPKLRLWLNNAIRYGGSFVCNFATACFCADQKNFEILLPVLKVISEKYPIYFTDDTNAR